jgi:hypothetical protein
MRFGDAENDGIGSSHGKRTTVDESIPLITSILSKLL